MLEDLSASIKALLEYELKTPGEEVVPDLSISFDQPDEEFPPASITKPAVNLFMYDIREDLKLRHNERFFYELNSPTTTTVSRNPLLVECSYLVTAWSDSEVAAAHDEHYVLSTIVKALRRYNCLPDTLPNKIDPNGAPVQILQGSLQGMFPLPRAFTIQDGYLQTLGEFWRSMGHEPKPRFNYTVTIAVDAFEPRERSVIDTVELSLAESAAPEAESDEATLQLLLPDDDARLLAGAEFLLATNIDADQRGPAVAAITGGGFIAAWRSSSSLIGEEPADLPGIAAQLYDADGNLVGAEFLANTFTVNDQRDVEVAGLRDGGFVMVWKTSDPATGDTGNGIAGRRYDGNGNAVTNEFLVNSVTLGDQEEPIVTGLADGGFVVMWESDTATGDDSGFGIVGQRYGSDNTAVGGEFLVNTFTSSNQRSVDVASLTDGGFITVWESNDPGIGDTDGIVAQRYDANGALVDSEFLVNTVTTSSQFGAKVAGLSNGGFVVIWDSDSASGDSSAQGVVGQLYGADSTAVGSEFLVNTFTGNSQSNADVASLADGGFVVAWETMDVATGDTDGIAARRYDVNGNALGSEFLVNTFTTDGQQIPEVTGLADGGIVVVWRTFDAGTGDDNGVAARQYAFADTLIVDVLANDTDVDPDDTLSLDSVTVTGELGQAWIAFNKLVFYAGTDFDYLDEGESTTVTVCYTMSDASGFSSDASVEITVVGRKHVYEAQLLVADGDEAGAKVKAGSEFLVNTHTVDTQDDPHILLLSDGTYFVFFESYEPAGDTEEWGIVGRHYSAEGEALGGEFVVNTHTMESQFDPHAVLFGDNKFVVVWQTGDEETGDSDPDSIAGRLFSEDGVPLGEEFLVNTHTNDFQSDPWVASTGNGGFVVVWQSASSLAGDAEPDSIAGRLFSATGVPLGDEFLVNTFTANDQNDPKAVGLTGGGFVVVWDSGDLATGDTSGQGLVARLFNANGEAQGAEFLVNTYTGNDQTDAHVAGLSDGGFVVVWETQDPATGDGDDQGIAARRFSATGVPLGDEFLVNTHTFDFQGDPNVASLTDGGFLVVWESEQPTGDTDGHGVVARRYDKDGIALGGEFLLNTYTGDYQTDPQVAALKDGGFVVAFESNDPVIGDTDFEGVVARHYQFTETFIIDVLAHKAGIYDSSSFTLDAVDALPAGSGTVSIVNNKMVFYAGTDFDYLDAGETAEVVINYTWTGNLGQTSNSSVTVKVIGRFLPPQLSNLKLWLESSTPSTITTADGAVSQWDDLSGNGFDLSQATSSLQPVSTLGNGIAFDGVSDVLTRGDALGLTGSPDITAFIVFENLNFTTSRYFKIGDGSGASLQLSYNAGGGIGAAIYSVVYGNGSINFNNIFTGDEIRFNERILITVNRPASTNHNSTRLWYNGVEISRTSSSTNNLNLSDNGYIVGAQDTSGTNTLGGIVFEHIVYEETFSDEDREKVESYLMGKWDVT